MFAAAESLEFERAGGHSRSDHEDARFDGEEVGEVDFHADEKKGRGKRRRGHGGRVPRPKKMG